MAGDGVEDNLNPPGRTFYGLSTVICTPGSLDQEVGLGLGAQAGERRLGEVLREAGFSRVRRAVVCLRDSWTPVQELVCRCAFQAVVTTNYDPGIVDARMRVRPDVSSTGRLSRTPTTSSPSGSAPTSTSPARTSRCSPARPNPEAS